MESPDFLNDEDVQFVHQLFIDITLVVYMPIIIFTNTLVFWATVLHPALRTPNNYLLCSLSVADFLMGAFTIPMYALSYSKATRNIVLFNKHLCLLWIASMHISGVGSLVNLMFIAIDRFIAVIKPLKYTRIVTLDRTKKFIIMMWAYIFFVAFLPMLGWNNYDHEEIDGVKRCYYYAVLPKYYVFWAKFGTIYFCVAASLFLYIWIVYVLYREKKIIKRPNVTWSLEKIAQFNNRASSFKISLVLIVISILLWLPYVIMGPLKYASVIPQKEVEIIKTLTQLLFFTNSMVNAPVYARGKKKYKFIYKLMLKTAPWKWRQKMREDYRLNVINRCLVSDIDRDKKKTETIDKMSTDFSSFVLRNKDENDIVMESRV